MEHSFVHSRLAQRIRPCASCAREGNCSCAHMISVFSQSSLKKLCFSLLDKPMFVCAIPLVCDIHMCRIGVDQETG